MKTLFSKGSPLILRLSLALLLAIALMVLDANYRAFKIVRYYLDTLVAPLHYAANTPKASFEAMFEMTKTRDELVQENAYLKQEISSRTSDLLLLEHLSHENDRLRELLGSPLRHDEHKMVAQVLLANSNPYSFQVVLDKGGRDGVYVGQPVVDEKGVVGQIFEIAETTSRAILLCDYQHAIPVQNQRNDIAMVAVGNGCNSDLLLDFLPNNVDVQKGDVLVTSGLDGRFPEGYPVAVVNSITPDPNDTNPVIHATPLADFKRLRYLLLLWGGMNSHTEVTVPAPADSKYNTQKPQGRTRDGR